MKQQAQYTELVAFKLTPEMRHELEQYSKKQDRDMSYIIRLAVSRLLNKKAATGGTVGGKDTDPALRG